jgi:endonuclease-3
MRPRKPARKPKKKSKCPARAPESTGTHPRRIGAILARLTAAHPAAECELHHEDPFQLLISTILSTQCTDERVNQMTATLFVKYPTPESFAHANPSELEQCIRPTSFFRNKTKSVMGASKKIVEEFGGRVPVTMANRRPMNSRRVGVKYTPFLNSRRRF